MIMEMLGIDIIRFFNFFLIFSVLVYAFRKYILPDLNLVLAQKESAEKKLYAKQSMLEETLFALTSEVASQKVLFEQLQEKIITWKAVVNQKSDENKQIETLLCARLEAQISKQLQEREIDLVFRKEVQNVVATLADDTIKRYRDQQNSDVLQQVIMSYIDTGGERKKPK